MKKKILKEATNLEFGMEFGDLNNAKLYELPFANQKNEKNKKPKK